MIESGRQLELRYFELTVFVKRDIGLMGDRNVEDS